MLLIGLLWITSWIGSFLSVNENLPPSFTSKMSPTKVSSNLGKLVSKHRPLFVLPKQQPNAWNTTLLPTSFLKMDWGTKESKPTPTQAPNHSLGEVNNSKNKLCGSLEEILASQHTVKTTSVVAVPSLIKPTPTNLEFLPNKILRSLQNFFRFSNPQDESFSPTSLPVVLVHRDEENYEVWLNNRIVANLPNEIQAKSMQQRLSQLVKSPSLDATQLQPALVDGIPALMAGNRFLFGIEKEISQKINRSGELLAIEWINNLRQALQVPALTLVQGQQEMYGLTPSKEKLSGLASWYGGYFHGRTTANGEKYNQDELTVAHKSLPFNTFLQVTNMQTGNSVIVRVNDRGPYIPPRSLDLSREAARCIKSETTGVVPYQAVIFQPSQPRMTLKSPSISTKSLKPTRKLAVVSDF